MSSLGLQSWVDEAPYPFDGNVNDDNNTLALAWPLLPCATSQQRHLQTNETASQQEVSLAKLLVVHRTGAAERLSGYYDRETAELATDIYAEDFTRFGYQIWKGPPDHIQLM